MTRWPRDNQSELIKFFGNPGTGEVSRQLVPFVPPFRMTYDGKPIKHLLVHRKTLDAFKSAFDKIWTYYGQDQGVVDKLHVSRTAGTYNCRKIRGSATKWSNHAYGGALDLNAEENGFGTGHGNLPLPVVAAFKSEGMRWGGDYRGRTDPMHVECCASGEPERTFEQWLDHYRLPHSYATPVAFADLPENGIAVDEAPVEEPEAEEAAEEPKPMVKSKIGWMQWLLGSVGLGGVGSTLDDSTQDVVTNAWAHADKIGLFRILTHAAQKPLFWVFVVVMIGAALTLYWRWRDYGKGAIA